MRKIEQNLSSIDQCPPQHLGIHRPELVLPTLGDIVYQVGISFRKHVTKVLVCSRLAEAILDFEQRGLGAWHSTAWFPVVARIRRLVIDVLFELLFIRRLEQIVGRGSDTQVAPLAVEEAVGGG